MRIHAWYLDTPRPTMRADQWYDAPACGKCRLSRRNTKLEMMNGTARIPMAGSVHHPAWAAITPPVAATENIGPTLETDNGTRSRSPKDWARPGPASGVDEDLLGTA